METEGGNRDPSEKSKQEIKCELQQISREWAERVHDATAGTQAEDREGDEKQQIRVNGVQERGKRDNRDNCVVLSFLLACLVTHVMCRTNKLQWNINWQMSGRQSHQSQTNKRLSVSYSKHHQRRGCQWTKRGLSCWWREGEETEESVEALVFGLPLWSVFSSLSLT